MKGSSASETGLDDRLSQPLCVDLDGTLLRTDSLLETVVFLCRRAPWRLPLLAVWALRGKAYLKHRLAEAAEIDTSMLPYNQEFLAFLREEHRRGRRILLATGSDARLATGVAGHLGIFEAVLASDGERNLVGSRKLAAIRQYLGDCSFSYAGNSRPDRVIWRAAASAVVVGDERCAIQLERDGQVVERLFRGGSVGVRDLIQAARIHQWVKNLLVFTPIFLAHHTFEPGFLRAGLLAFMAFSFCASAVYICNDILDAESDRKHPRKRNRPFASGALSFAQGAVMVSLLLAAAFSLCLFMPPSAGLILFTYLAAAMAYTLVLKRMLFVDVVTLAAFYTVRMLFGGAATGVPISMWTIAFSMFLFQSLALAKRTSELRTAIGQHKDTVSGRGYLAIDVQQVASLGAASGYLAVLVLALYADSKEVHLLYTHPKVLWLMCPVLAYWLGRLWLLCNRGRVHDDPVVFALTDRASLCVLLIALSIVLAAR